MDLLIFPNTPAGTGIPESSRQEMTRLINRLAPADGGHRTAIPSLSFFRCSAPSESECAFTKASLVLAVQGQKRIVLAGQAYDYGPMHGPGHVDGSARDGASHRRHGRRALSLSGL